MLTRYIELTCDRCRKRQRLEYQERGVSMDDASEGWADYWPAQVTPLGWPPATDQRQLVCRDCLTEPEAAELQQREEAPDARELF